MTVVLFKGVPRKALGKTWETRRLRGRISLLGGYTS
jgi:hypothetical protein